MRKEQLYENRANKAELETKAIVDYVDAVGKVIATKWVVAYDHKQESVDVHFPEPRHFIVEISPSIQETLINWRDGHLDPIWTLKPIGRQPELRGLSGVYTFGHSYSLDGEKGAGLFKLLNTPVWLLHVKLLLSRIVKAIRTQKG